MKTKTKKQDLQKTLFNVESTLESYFGKKAPQLPPTIKEFIVKYGPYITIVMLILGLPIILTALGLGALLAPLSIVGGVNTGFHFSIGLLLSLVMFVLQIKALPGLFKRKASAWRLMFYISLISALGAILALNLGSLIIGAVISWYFLFQIKSYYK